jgi:hypothetical protein
VEFYGNFPPDDETVQTPEIPGPLFELAESLMKDDKEVGSRILREIEKL